MLVLRNRNARMPGPSDTLCLQRVADCGVEDAPQQMSAPRTFASWPGGLFGDQQLWCRPTMAPSDDHALVTALRNGDEATFAALVTRYHASLRRVARTFVSSDASADEVVQDTWAAVLHGIGEFEGRASFKTWLFRILVNRAKTRGVREARIVPESSLASDDDAGTDGPTVDPARFTSKGHWASPPQRWEAMTPESLLLRDELVVQLQTAIAQLPARLASIVVMRDALGWSSEEVCNILEIAETHQRVLLHRARARLRAMLETYKNHG